MIAIIGAGLSGLTAAKVLQENNIDFTIFDKNTQVGGRVRSDYKNGFTFDRGFQVLLNSYPQIKKHIDLNKLEVREFQPGAQIYQEPGNLVKVGDPLRRPSDLVETITAPIGSLKDKFNILRLKFQNKATNESTINYLTQLGFSEKIINSFFKPFFSGVFLEKELKTDADYFLFLYQRFSKGLATLPRYGMQALPNQLAESFKDRIKLNTNITHIEKQDNGYVLSFEKMEDKFFDKIIMAVDAPTLNKFFPEAKAPTEKRVVTTLYFESSREISEGDYLVLNGSGEGRVNHIAFLSQVQKSYSPKEKFLISVNILDNDDVDPKEIIQEVSEWNVFSTSDWKHLATYKIPYAQPDHFWKGTHDNKLEDNLYLAGDFTQTPSIEGAMRAGELAAENLLKTI